MRKQGFLTCLEGNIPISLVEMTFGLFVSGYVLKKMLCFLEGVCLFV